MPNTLPVQLHIIHDLGGGSATWLRDFCLADIGRKNLVLRSFTQNTAMGCGVSLYAHVLDETPLEIWHFANQIQATVVAHMEYSRVLDEIIQQYNVDALLVSSFIGHSLDALRTNLPTVVINHDYFPYCPAINIHFGEVCKQCDGNRIERCYRDNPKFNPFITFQPPERAEVREEFLRLVAQPNVTMVTPSHSVETYLVRLDARFLGARFKTIAHGYAGVLTKIDAPMPLENDRLRILVLGQLSVAKGVELLHTTLDSLTEFADIYLLGCRELGEYFKFKVGVHVLERYAVEELASHVAAINPHVGLLMSIVPETFSYALTELMLLGIPTAATNVGSFPERIRHLENGFLYDPNAPTLLATMKMINNNRATLKSIQRNLCDWKPHTVDAMVLDYHQVLGISAAVSEITVIDTSEGKLRDMQSTNDPDVVQMQLTQSLTVSSMWKEIKSLNLQLSVTKQAREDLVIQRQALSTQLDTERDAAQDAIQALNSQIEALVRQATELQGANSDHAAQMDSLNARFDEVLASKSWKMTRPVRALGHLLRKLKLLIRAFARLLGAPASLSANSAKLAEAWQSGGTLALKNALVSVQANVSPVDAWKEYKATFDREVKPKISRRIREMTVMPKIAIIVPTYNTPEKTLREMLDSIKAQLYPNWELCIADDGSDQLHVSQVLEEYAASESRIKLHFGAKNCGVSHASNRALENVTSEFVVLLDHDDRLEVQALFRVAECLVNDDPDVIYSDEVLVTPDLEKVLRFAYRPAFSPEFLRSHPYIVHMVGFRTSVLREIGGFDETLHISQDYDLILRAVDRAKRIVHIPEILYQWRILPSSSGEKRIHEVMETSKAVLQRHLDRCEEDGFIEDGDGFNLFHARYPLHSGLKVAIIIPTKNHGELLRQCIDSIRKTTFGVAYDIVVIDHESEDVDTKTYLSSIIPEVQVLRYEGKFNFSAINNWAVAQLDGGYSHYLFCNNDIEAINQGWLERMLELGQRQSIGIVGAKLLYPDRKTIQHAGVCVGMYGAAEHYGKFLRPPESTGEPGYLEVLRSNHEVSAVTAACMLIREEVFATIGGFDEALSVGFGDVDLCLRVRELGHSILYCAHAELLHHESYTRGKSTVDPHPEDSAFFQAKWRKILKAGDPYFNPGLSLTSTAWHNASPLHCSFDIRRRVFEQDVATCMQKKSI
ncbi:MAG: glycosyltransferase [Betaproteobacteria bacterium]